MINKKISVAAAVAAALATCSTAALAESTVTLYGTIDQYINYLRSSSGERIIALEDGAYTRTRFGLRGAEDLGNGLRAKFNLESGLNADDGTSAERTRLFDRQAWVGMSGGWGEFRVGRQNTVLVPRGGYIDPTGRTLGSVFNAFGIPARYDNDVMYLSPKIAGFVLEAHYALAEQPYQSRQAVKQLAVDYENGPYRLGYGGVTAKPQSPAEYTASVQYHNLFANYDYGQGRIYLAFARTNNSTATSSGNNAGSILSGIGGVVAGTNPDVDRFYHLYQISADYRATPQLRVAALYGLISDRSNSDRSASGVTVAAYYDLSKRTTIYSIAEQLRNRGTAGFRLAGSAGLKSNFSTPNDVNGRSVTGMQVGILHRF